MQFALLIHYLTITLFVRNIELQGKVLVSAGIEKACTAKTYPHRQCSCAGVCHIAVFIVLKAMIK